MDTCRVAILGAGSWGTAFANLVAPHVKEVCLWSHSDEVAQGISELHKNPRYIKDCKLAENVSATTSFQDCLEGARYIVIATPSSFIRQVCESCSPYIDKATPILVLTKGIEAHSGLLMCDLVADVVGGRQRLACLSGPNHAEEIGQNKISAAVVGAYELGVAKAFQEIVSSRNFRTYISQDIRGVEVCSAAKNIIAIACGAAWRLGVGDNCLAVLMTRGLAEIGRIVSATGGDPMTCMGLAGMGDLMATCTSPHSRNRSFGVALIDGVSLEEYEAQTHMVVEGAKACASVYELAQNYEIQIPITQAVWSMLYDRVGPQEAIDSLLERFPQMEFYDFK